jgi:hypothetical protein
MKPPKREPFLIDIVDEFIEFDDPAVTDARKLARLKVLKAQPPAAPAPAASQEGSAARSTNGAKKSRKQPKRRGK